MYLNEKNELVYEAKQKGLIIKQEEQESYYSWLKQYFSLYIIANLSNDEMSEYYQYKMKKKIERE